jgi:hypothetical protein
MTAFRVIKKIIKAILPYGLIVLRAHILSRKRIKRIDAVASLFCREWICAPNDNAPNILLKIRGGLGESFFLSRKRPSILSPVLQWARKEN